jgi:hypothetical protein
MKGPEARGPTSATPPETRPTGDAPPPLPPHELSRGETSPREFEHEGEIWTARLSGKSAWGTGSYGLGLVEAVHFAAASEPAVPLREALLARGRFEHLHDAELAELLRQSRPIERPDAR